MEHKRYSFTVKFKWVSDQFEEYLKTNRLKRTPVLRKMFAEFVEKECGLDALESSS